ncbi:gamma carbonic anhydrase family protein [Sphingomonas sanguinis]|uniref:gamma carbonic anhydrase family protein n=1 Tax=Sphingomonas sp. LC-1 TaxID=3110957 RepID=UPI0021BB72B1|nr:gamma carbonic anhydrase family protein [Sphingomonas sp. LC-1]MCT8002195.1 gamma carbonic anhydrase family protein [Sphingomonas sp. LC-1]
MPLYAMGEHRPVIDPSAWIAPSADVVGQAIVAEQVSLWFGAIVRADNGPIHIGARSNVQDGAVLHSDPGSPLTIGADCTIGHRAILHGCTVEDGCLIGMGATILNDAVIGSGSLVGAGALVTEGKIFPPHSLIVGVPARAVRTLEPDQVARLGLSAEGYAARAARYAVHLQRLDADQAEPVVDVRGPAA